MFRSSAVLAMMLYVTVAGAQLAAPSVPPATPASGGLVLRLICMGTGDREVAHSSWATAATNNGSASAFGVSHSQEQFDDQMDVDLNGSAARARVPRRFLPPLHGGDGGWFNVNDVMVTDDAITGNADIKRTAVRAEHAGRLHPFLRCGNHAAVGPLGPLALPRVRHARTPNVLDAVASLRRWRCRLAYIIHGVLTCRAMFWNTLVQIRFRSQTR